MRALLILVGLVMVGGAVAWANPADEKGTDFTPWMSHAGLDVFLKQFDTNPPGGHPNYWDHGHWINAVEGRWRDGMDQYRIKYGPAPRTYGYSWYWFFDQDAQSFKRHAQEFAAKGMILLDPNSYVRPDQTRCFQGVWHSAPPKGAPAVNPALTSGSAEEKLKALSDDIKKAVATQTDPQAFNALLSEIQSVTNSLQSSGSAEPAAVSHQLEGDTRFVNEWQAYLSDDEAGNFHGASDDLRTLAQDDDGVMPKPELLRRAQMESGKAAGVAVPK